MTAKSVQTGKILAKEVKEYFQIGLDFEGDRRYGAWQIKDIIDYTLPPRAITTEKFYFVFEPQTKIVDLDIVIKYIHKPNVEFTVHKLNYKVEYTN